jgi:hypothetical protein
VIFKQKQRVICGITLGSNRFNIHSLDKVRRLDTINLNEYKSEKIMGRIYRHDE